MGRSLPFRTPIVWDKECSHTRRSNSYKNEKKCLNLFVRIAGIMMMKNSCFCCCSLVLPTVRNAIWFYAHANQVLHQLFLTYFFTEKLFRFPGRSPFLSKSFLKQSRKPTTKARSLSSYLSEWLRFSRLFLLVLVSKRKLEKYSNRQ